MTLTNDEVLVVAFHTRNLRAGTNWEKSIENALQCYEKIKKQENLSEEDKSNFLQQYALAREVAALKKFAQKTTLPVSLALIERCDHMVGFFEKPSVAPSQTSLFEKPKSFQRHDLETLFLRLRFQESVQLKPRNPS